MTLPPLEILLQELDKGLALRFHVHDKEEMETHRALIAQLKAEQIPFKVFVDVTESAVLIVRT